MWSHLWNYLYYPSPQSFQDSTDTSNNSTYTQAQYQSRPAQEWGGKGVTQFNMIQSPTQGSSGVNNYGSDYFMDAFGYMVGYQPQVSPTEPQSYGAGQWVTVNGVRQYVAQPIANDQIFRVPN